MTEYFVVCDQALCYQDSSLQDHHPDKYHILSHRFTHFHQGNTLWCSDNAKYQNVRKATEEDFVRYRVMPPDNLFKTERIEKTKESA